MLTIFTVPKPFKEHINIIQRNAICSWKMLSTNPEIILLGSEDGTAEICNEFGLIHVSEIDRNEYDTPLLDDAFAKAQDIAINDIVCYVNADIIFTDKLIGSVSRVRKWKNKYLIIGRRWNLDVDREINFQSNEWQDEITTLALNTDNQATPYSIDYFIFPRGLYDKIPPFLVGRAFWDNWFIWNAIDKGIPVIDASAVNITIHQNHDYSHHPDGRKGAYEGAEASHNSGLLGGRTHYYSISDANFILTNNGVKRNLSKEYFLSKYHLLIWILMYRTRYLRHKIGIRSSNIGKLSQIFHKFIKH